MLVRLLYASRAADHQLCDTIMHNIMEKSRTYNPAHGITGILCHSNQIFLQLLEGGREEVNALYSKILRDPRHTDVVLLDYEEVLARRFSGWTMGQVNISKLNPAILIKYSALPELHPHQLSGKASLALIEELSATASIVGRS